SDRAHRRRARRRRAVIAGLLALTVTAVTTAGIAVRNAANAARQHAIALSRQLAAEGLGLDLTDPVTARRLAVAAWRVFPTVQAGSAMTALLAEQQQDGILPADPSGVNGIAFSPSGTVLASAGDDGTVRLWNPATGQAVGPPLVVGTRKGVNAVAFSPDGRLLASAGRDGTVRLWNPVTGRAVRVLQATGSTRGGVRAVAFSPNSKLLATADSDGTVRLWNPATGRAVRVLHAASTQGGVSAVTFSPDGTLLATGGDMVQLWNPATGRAVRVLHAPSTQGGVSAVAFSPDGTLLATGGGSAVGVWDPATSPPAGPPIHAARRHAGGFR